MDIRTQDKKLLPTIETQPIELEHHLNSDIMKQKLENIMDLVTCYTFFFLDQSEMLQTYCKYLSYLQNVLQKGNKIYYSAYSSIATITISIYNN